MVYGSHESGRWFLHDDDDEVITSFATQDELLDAMHAIESSMDETVIERPLVPQLV